MITINIYYTRKFSIFYKITKVCLFGFLPLFIKKVEVK